MDGKAARSIEAILEAYERKQQAERLEMELRRTQRQEFLAGFSAKIQSVVRPVMVEAAELLRRSGHEYEIIENSDGLQPDGRNLNAAITLMIFPNGERPSDPRNEDLKGWPHVAFFVHPKRNTVQVFESAMMPGVGGVCGTEGEYPLDEITEAVTQKHIVSVLSRAMGIGKAKRAPRVRRRVSDKQDERIPAAFNYLSR